MSLSQQQIDRYQQSGYLCPLRVFSKEQSQKLRQSLESIEASQGFKLNRAQCNKSYLLFDWADEIVHHPKILDAVESLIGPNILCYMTNLFIKEPNSEAFVSMHQDAQYWGVEADDVVTAWVALSPANEHSGGMKVIPESHQILFEQQNTYAKNNLLTRGQTIDDERFDEANQVFMELNTGEMSLHHFKLAHGSSANHSSDRRIGFAIRYVNASANKIGKPESALLVRGKNKGNFLLEQRIQGLSDKSRRRQHAGALRRQLHNLLEPDVHAGLAERLRLKVFKSVALAQSYWLTLKNL
ncbi:MAG: phytanoyl-CoA dioxygenase family protein [Parashewanella sp.]